MVYSYRKLGCLVALWTGSFLVYRFLCISLKVRVQFLFLFCFVLCVCLVFGFCVFFSPPNKIGFLPSGEQICPIGSASCLTKIFKAMNNGESKTNLGSDKAKCCSACHEATGITDAL